jgi:opacity protein-like surface antigen
MKSLILAATMAAVAMPAAPALAQTPRQTNREYNKDVKKAQKELRRDLRQADDRQDVQDARQDYRREVRDARQDRREDMRDWRQYRNYDYNRPAPGQGRYYADRYYRDGAYYQPRRLGYGERIYRGQNGQYYCRRSDGTTGLIIGGLAGGALGNVVAPGDSQTIGTILGGAAGALLGRSIDRNNITCR